MKAITLYQPWASAIADRNKIFETRSWANQRMVGQTIAIHAGKSNCFDNLKHYFIRELDAIGYTPDQAFGGDPYELPTGVIVATAKIVKIYRTHELAKETFSGDYHLTADSLQEGMSQLETILGDFSHGRYAWKLGEVYKLPEPIPCKGKQLFWDVPQEVVTAIGWQYYKDNKPNGS